ncbi:response regulator [Flavisolibacter tropicus]|uniref:Histidine kinase n=1 Tax=Flavisolibacter tropicus TaxID=1492898 RepID=A0A172TZE8_9BACT|nr:response regulator [Flavisolibacter tropicus]ANE52376.1 histidine kinase [Flavisolibacter tropicus]
MAKTGPIIIVEDDLEDQEVIADVLQLNGVTNELKFFSNGKEALDYLTETIDHPFLIICDINMPVMNGLELKDEINKNESLAQKCIPFIYYTTHAEKHAVEKAYHMAVQGFFQKPGTINEMQQLLNQVVGYWLSSFYPNNQ